MTRQFHADAQFAAVVRIQCFLKEYAEAFFWLTEMNGSLRHIFPSAFKFAFIADSQNHALGIAL